MTLTFTLDDRAVTQALARLQKNASDLSSPMRQIASELAESARDAFGQSTDPWGDAWEPLSVQTKIRRLGGTGKVFTKKGGLRKGAIRRAAGGFQPLLDTGRLRNSISQRSGRDFAEAGTSVIYAATHQFGRGNIPARPFLPLRNGRVDLPPAQIKRIVAIIEDALLGGL